MEYFEGGFALLPLHICARARGMLNNCIFQQIVIIFPTFDSYRKLLKHLHEHRKHDKPGMV